MNFGTMAPAPAPAPARQAALTVHALSDADRGWLLASLPAAERERLQELLDELLALGIPRDGTLAAELANVAAPAAPQRDWLQELDASGALAMASVLREQPLEFTRAVRAVAPASAWRRLEEALGGEEPGTPRVGPPLPPALARAIRAALEPRWKDAMAHQVLVKPRTGWRAFTTRLAGVARGLRA